MTLFRGSKAESRLKRHDVIRNLMVPPLRSPAAYMASPPAILVQTASSLTSATGGACSHPWTGGLLNAGIEPFVLTGSVYGSGSQTLNDNSKTDGGLTRLRFMTDEPSFEVVTGYLNNATMNIIVDGEVAYQNFPAYWSNTGSPRYTKFTFPTVTTLLEVLGASVTAGGSGYVVGDQITLTGGTPTSPLVVEVTTVTSGAVTGIRIVDRGAYPAKYASAMTQASTTGSGTGCTVTASSTAWGTKQSDRVLRRIEIHAKGSIRFYGINVGGKGQVLAWPVPNTLPRVVFLGDSQSAGTVLRHAADHLPSQIAQRLGLQDCYAINAAGGTGWVTNNGSVLMWSDSRRIADVVSLAPDVLVPLGSQNDPQNSATTAAVTSTLEAIGAALPNCLMVGIGPVNSVDGSATKAGWQAFSGYGSRALFVDNFTVPWITGTAQSAGGTAGNNSREVCISSDGQHLDASGRAYWSRLAAEAIRQSLLTLTA